MAKNKKDTSAIVSALGILMSIITALVSAVKRQGGTDADIYRLATPEGESLIEKIAALIVQAGKPIEQLAENCYKVPAIPSEPPYLMDTGNRHVMQSCEEFDVEKWVESLKKYDQGGNFRNLVKGRKEVNIQAGQLRQFYNTRAGNGADIVKEIKAVHGGEYANFADIKTFIESDAAKKDGTWYVTMVKIDGQEWLVFFNWLDYLSRDGWNLYAYHPEDYDFYDVNQFLSRDSA